MSAPRTDASAEGRRMSAPRADDRADRALQMAIEQAFFRGGSAAHIAQCFSTGGRRLHAADVARIWRRAKAEGRLPNLRRPMRGQPDKRRA